MSQLKDAYSPNDGQAYEIVKLITHDVQNEKGPHQNSRYHNWQEATKITEKYLRISSEKPGKTHHALF